MNTTNQLLCAFSVIVLFLAITATAKTPKRQPERLPTVILSQNPVPACPPFCNDPDTGPDTAAAKR